MATLSISGVSEVDVFETGDLAVDKWSFYDRFTFDYVEEGNSSD
ncbi:hypothetical protein ACUSIJ_26525 [Pseudochelatococcus sp. B33]